MSKNSNQHDYRYQYFVNENEVYVKVRRVGLLTPKTDEIES